MYDLSGEYPCYVNVEQLKDVLCFNLVYFRIMFCYLAFNTSKEANIHKGVHIFMQVYILSKTVNIALVITANIELKLNQDVCAQIEVWFGTRYA